MNSLIQVLLYNQCLLIVGISALFGPGAQPMTSNDFPFVVSLTSAQTGAHLCGGTLITKKHILTTENCLMDWNKQREKPWNFKVRIGSHDLRKCSLLDISYYDTFEDWAYLQPEEDIDRTLHHDLAVVTLTNDIPDDLKIEPAQLSDLNDNHKSFLKQKFVTAGWGSNNKGECNILLFAPMKPINKEISKKNYENIEEPYNTPRRERMHTNHVCTLGAESKHVMLARDDYGGPLLCENKVVGVNSHVTQYDYHDAMFHNGHTSLSYAPYRRFIESYTKVKVPLRSTDDEASPSGTSPGSPPLPRHNRCSLSKCTIL